MCFYCRPVNMFMFHWPRTRNTWFFASPSGIAVTSNIKKPVTEYPFRLLAMSELVLQKT
jgi:hypothetical protein